MSHFYARFYAASRPSCEAVADSDRAPGAPVYDPNVEWDANFWSGVGIASAVATALATLIALLFSTWWRRIDRHAAEWAFFDGSAVWRSELAPGGDCRLANTGAGTAYQVKVRGVGCNIEAHGEYVRGDWGSSAASISMIPAMKPGDTVGVWFRCEPSQWERAVVAITWREPGSWRRKRRRCMHRERLADIAAKPRYGRTVSNESGSPTFIPITPEPEEPLLRPGYEENNALPTGWFGKRAYDWHRLRLRA